MNKQEILKLYKNEEDRLLVAKMLDQLEACKKKSKVTYTNFTDERQKMILQKVLNHVKETNYINNGGFEEAQRTIFMFYPDRFTEEMIKKSYSDIIQIIQINLPNEQRGKYTHRDYLGGLMKLGIKREMIGDIIVSELGAQIIVMKEIISFLKEHLGDLVRFQKADILLKTLEDISLQPIQKEEIEIIVSSMRIDNIVSELARTSRTKAEEFIRSERVIVNYEVVSKNSKTIQSGDKITIRGKGKFEIVEPKGNTKKDRIILKIQKYK